MIIISAQLLFNIQNQIITRTDNFQPVAKSRDYLRAGFTFSADWNESGAEKIAVFKDGGRAYKVIIDENDECIVPWEALTNAGTLYVSVFCGNRITASTAQVPIMQSGYTDETTATQDPSIDVFAELMGRMNEIDEHIGEKVDEVLTQELDTHVTDVINAMKEAGELGGTSIESVTVNDDGSLTFVFTNGEELTTEPLKGNVDVAEIETMINEATETLRTEILESIETVTDEELESAFQELGLLPSSVIDDMTANSGVLDKDNFTSLVDEAVVGYSTVGEEIETYSSAIGEAVIGSSTVISNE